ncbi:MAG TPA: alpha-L-fucosidase [Gemmatimonadaceae bacterium]|nr:alpha-L-fucosidase [Gemmatimonadaceae bacterium]
MNRRDLIMSGMAAMTASGLLRFRRGWRGYPPVGAVPSSAQLAWHDMAMGMFLHFGINTFTDREWGDGTEDPKTFNPERLDARQWMRAAVAGGFRYVVLTAKHHDGFCLWPSRVTDHSVKSSPWREGKGDVVRDVADAAREAGLGLGLYLSPWDRNARSYGSGEGYNDFYLAQLTELLTNYGPLTEVWFDGANGEGPNGKKQKYDWPRIHATVRRLQPNALMFSDAGPDIRWIGNERGTAGDPNWCTVDPSIVTEPGLDGPEIIRSLQHGDAPPRGTVWRPGEADVSIRPGWFHHAAEDAKVKSADALMEIWFNSVGRNANLLLNVPPARDGLIAGADMRSLEAFGAAQRAFRDRIVAAAVRRAADGSLEVRFGARERIAAVVLEEDIAAGQRVNGYRVEAVGANGAEATIARGTTIGRRKIDRFDPVTATSVRILLQDATSLSAITSVSAVRA